MGTVQPIKSNYDTQQFVAYPLELRSPPNDLKFL